MINIKDITIISLNILPVTDFRSTQNLLQIHMQRKVDSLRREGDLRHE